MSAVAARDRSRLAVRTDALARRLLSTLGSGVLPVYVVTEHPRSGGTWFAQMLAAHLGLPFPRNRIPPIRSCVIHGHFGYSPRLRNVFVVIRDGRDVMVSYYCYCLLESELHSRWQVEAWRRELGPRDPEDVTGNLPAFIERVASRRGSWGSFVRNWWGRGAPLVRYEALLREPVETMAGAIRRATGDAPDRGRLEEIAARFSFQAQARRRPGQEDARSFLRKGVSGDWRRRFSPEARRVFDRHFGEELVLAGYEPDRSWVERGSDVEEASRG